MLQSIVVLPSISDKTKAAVNKIQTHLDSVGHDQDKANQVLTESVEVDIILKDQNVRDTTKNTLNYLLRGMSGPDNTTTNNQCKICLFYL